MRVQITITTEGREAHVVEREIGGTPEQREERAHACGCEVGCVIAEQALAEAAAEARHPHGCRHAMANKGWQRLTLKGLDGEIRVRRRRARCEGCGRRCTRRTAC